MRSLFWGEIRRRWRGAALVGLVLGLGFGAALTAAAGARRTNAAFPHLLTATHAPQLLAGLRGSGTTNNFYDRVAQLDGVRRVGVVVGVGLVPTHVSKGAGTALSGCSMASYDGVFGYAVDRPNVVAGRLPDPARANEVLVTRSYADQFGVRIGDRVDASISSNTQPAAGAATAADGPVVALDVVGIGIPAAAVVPLSDLDNAPVMFATPAFVRAHLGDPRTWCYDAGAVELRPGTDINSISRAIDEIGRPLDSGVFVQDLTSNYADVRRAIQPQVSALWLFAVAAAVATVMAVAQLLGRQLQEAGADVPVWRALGTLRSQSRLLIAAPSLVTAVVGAIVAVGISLAMSGQFPIGPARLAETNAGIRVDRAVLVLGAAAVLIVPLVVGVVASIMSVRGLERTHRGGLLQRVRIGSSRPAVVVGVHLATSTGRGRTAVPVRSAMAGTALALAAVLATMTFATGLDDLVSTPARYGRDWDLMIDGIFGPTPVAKVLGELGRDPAVSAIAGGRYGEVNIDGQRVPTVGLVDLVGTTLPGVIEGRAPLRDDELVIGERSLRQLHRSIGDTVTVDTGQGPKQMRLVGAVAFPRLNHGSFSTLGLGEGALLPAAAFAPFDFGSLGPPPQGWDKADFVDPHGAGYEFLTIRMRSDAAKCDRERVIAVAQKMIHGLPVVLRFDQRPIAIDNYASIRSTTALLALLLGFMATATMGHLVISVVRRRRRDLAVCAALGMRRAQVLRALVIQTVLVAGFALVVGLPIGAAAGRQAWIRFASNLGVGGALRLPVPTFALAVPTVALSAVAVALVPSIVASRQRPGAVLRSE